MSPTATATAGRFQLVHPPLGPVPPPELDPAQQHVVDHATGPLLVLAGPGTGKTTTLVEAVVARVDAGLSPEQVLVLTFGRKAAAELRERIAVRLGRTTVEPAAFTFHGFCHAVVRADATRLGLLPPRLLSGAEREVRVAELLRGNAAGEGLTRWPADLFPALRLRGFAREVADLIDRARERGLDAASLRALGVGNDRPAWRAAGDFLDEYLDVLDSRDEIDYAGLVARATAIVAADDSLRGRFEAVYVDEYQDTDPAQERLLHSLAGQGRLLVVVGDPDQSIYAFRGADVDNILEFPRRFRQADGSNAPVVSLGTCRRMPPELLAPSRELARRIPLGSLHRERDRHRGLVAVGSTALEPPQLRLFATVADEVTGIADLLRRAHLLDGLRWDAMAVLVRSGVRSIPVLRRVLVAAGVPVAVAADEVQLAHDPALAPLVTALRVAAAPDPVGALTADAARTLLLSPLGGATPATLRALGRRLREAARAAGTTTPSPSGELIRQAITDTSACAGFEEWVAAPLRRLHDALLEARRLVRAGVAPDEVLWSLWDGSGWGRRLDAAAAGVGAAARAADRDLDAVVALFDAAARLEDRRPRAGVSALLEEIDAQEIPAGPTAERSTAQGSVRLLTAHRSKGLEWDLVVVAGVHEGVWPDLRRRSSLLDADAIGHDRPGGPNVRQPPSPGQLLAEERRLFYVALTRARRRLVVTAVSGVDDEAERPSRFLEELGLPLPESVEAGARELLSAPSLVARLRRALDEASGEVAAEAAGWLAVLAAARDGADHPLVPAADPAGWWGIREPTIGATPLRDPAQPVALSGSAVSAYTECPRRWFLGREVNARGVSEASAGFGSVIHALAEAVAAGEIEPRLDALLAEVDRVWDSLPFDAPWQRARERAEAVEVLERFLHWHANNPRTLLGVEQEFDVDVGEAVLRGRADRLERDVDGSLVVVDLKTGRSNKKQDDVESDPQLGVYQLAARHGGFADVGAGAAGVAELVQLRQSSKGKVKVQRQPGLPAESSTWADELVALAVKGIRDEAFPARPSKRCGYCEFAGSCPATDAGGQVIG